MPPWSKALTLTSILLFATTVSVATAGVPGLLRLDIPETGSYALLYVPHSAAPGAELPLIVFLHGSGSSPEAWRAFLEPVAESLGFALLSPAATHAAGFGVGADDVTIARAIELGRERTAISPRRIALAGHSAGGAYAIVLGYSGELRLSGIFSLAAPYRTVLSLGDPDYSPPLRAYYGDHDPNFIGGSGPLLLEQLERLGVAVEVDVASGFGHSSWPEGTLEAGLGFLLEQSYGTAGGCVPDELRLCLREGRFAVTVSWSDFKGRQGSGRVAPARTPASGIFTFFSPGNWELLLKVLDGCGTNGHYWVLGSASTNVEYTVTVRDLAAAATWEYTNPLGTLSPAIADIEAFATCP